MGDQKVVIKLSALKPLFKEACTAANQPKQVMTEEQSAAQAAEEAEWAQYVALSLFVNSGVCVNIAFSATTRCSRETGTPATIKTARVACFACCILNCDAAFSSLCKTFALVLAFTNMNDIMY